MQHRSFVLGCAAGAVGTVGLVVAASYATNPWVQTLQLAMVLVWFVVLVALVVQVRRSEQLRKSADRSERLARTVSDARRRILSDANPREAVVDAIISVTHAKLAVLLEPEAGALRLTASAGVHVPDVRLPFDRPSVAVRVFRTSTPATVHNVHEEEHARETLQGIEAALAMEIHAIAFVPVIDHGGDEVLGVLGAAFDVEDQGVANEAGDLLLRLASEAAVGIERERMVLQLHELTVTDALTGISNLRGWRAACESMPRVGAMLVIDLDHFKRVNDTHGHAVGDLVLQAFAGVLSATVRAEDVVARIGGEEFAVLLPAGDDVDGLVERLRSAWSIADQGNVTFSGGVARREPGESAAEVQQRCDRALYLAKQQGRDRVLWADGDTPPITPQVNDLDCGDGGQGLD